MIGDGMGYNTLDLANLYHRNTTGYPVGQHGEKPPNTPQPGFQSWQRVSMSTYPAFGTYNTFVNWSSTEGATGKPTDSAAAGTAMATGHKTLRGVIGMDIFNRL